MNFLFLILTVIIISAITVALAIEFFDFKRRKRRVFWKSLYRHPQRILKNFGLVTGVFIFLSLVVALIFGMRPVATEDEGAILKPHLSNIHKDQPYREPTKVEVEQFLEDFQKLMDGNSDETVHLSDLGYAVTTATDATSGKKYIIATNEHGTERAWGAFLLPVKQPVEYVIAVPHPKADINTENIALDLWRRTDNTMLMIAGAHRDAADELADVAAEEGSLFHQVSDFLLQKNIGHMQIHGYADSTAEEKDVIVSSGKAKVYPVMRRMTNEIKKEGFEVGTSWDRETDILLAKHNVQGHSARRYDSLFIHLEMNYTIRKSDENIENILRIIDKKL